MYKLSGKYLLAVYRHFVHFNNYIRDFVSQFSNLFKYITSKYITLQTRIMLYNYMIQLRSNKEALIN